ncbi:DNA topoisomerase I, partial [Candidatus Woesearchaeota archaeon]|nr:DNA topoisomerase I [Candidatus Woesearchaeota archaeon]
KRETNQKVAYYLLKHNGKDIVVTCAVGHLYGLAEKNKKGWTYPVFDIGWKPTSELTKSAAFTKKYLQTIKKLVKDANSFTVATDYDVEGEVIGLNVVRFACKKKDANRMKFSTLTKSELVESYETKVKHLNWGQANAGETRHMLDWYWGINLSRALTLAIKKARGGGFRLMSIGRVQGPALKLFVDREKEISAFTPEPFWILQLDTEKQETLIQAFHQEGKFWDADKVSQIFEKIKDEKNTTIKDIKKNQFKQQPPNPFDLTSLQIEAYKVLRMTPKRTLAVAQDLYIGGFISYPRTSSQKLPAKLGFKNILKGLSEQEQYKELCSQLLKKKELIPNEGKKTDDAHPAIYPTGTVPKKLKDEGKRLYDLIVRRFLATFAEPALRETVKVFFDVKEEIFVAEGSRTVQENWHIFYKPYIKFKEIEFPAMDVGETLPVKQLLKIDKQTEPPKRYTESSIIKALEKANLGTKSTRAQIIDTLFQRGYVDGKPIGATEIGIKTIEILGKYEPEIVSEELTRHFEEEMEHISKGKAKEDAVLDEAKKRLAKILGSFKKHEMEIGKGLSEAEKTAYAAATIIGKCPNCGGELQIRKSKFGKFIGCTGYPDCKTTFGLPNNAKVKPTGKTCSECGYPLVEVRYPRQSPKEVCINPKCITWTPEYQKKEKEELEKKKELEKLESQAQ